MRSTGPLREKIILLSSIGFLDRPIYGASMYTISQKGKVFLDILKRLDKELNEESLSDELIFILSKLDCQYVTKTKVAEDDNIRSKNSYINLVRTILDAKKCWHLDFLNMTFITKHVSLP